MIKKNSFMPILPAVLLQDQVEKGLPANFLLYFAIAAVLVLLFLVIKFHWDRKTMMTLLEKKKSQLETRYRKLEEAFSYAERIQTAILPPPGKAEEILNEHFIFFKPQQAVGGDFYWIEQRGGKKMFSVIDCTGHGVAGSLMSIIAYDGINRAIIDYELTRADKIVSALKEYFTDTLRHTGSIDIKDALDLALCVINKDRTQLEYSGARDSLYLVRVGGEKLRVDDQETDPVTEEGHAALYEIKPDRKSVEPTEKAETFTNHRIKIMEGDFVYLLSDGFPDQFGGPDGKKYGYNQMRELLLSLRDLSMRDQRKKVENALHDWMKNQEQVDDITVMGVKI